MLDHIIQLLWQINLLQSWLSLVEWNQTASSNFIIREFVDNDSIYFIIREWLASVFLVPFLTADFTLLLFLPAWLGIDNIR